jgi:hypothetical protein
VSFTGALMSATAGTVLVLVTALLSSGFDAPAPLGALFGC